MTSFIVTESHCMHWDSHHMYRTWSERYRGLHTHHGTPGDERYRGSHTHTHTHATASPIDEESQQASVTGKDAQIKTHK